jgi:hypothetical protein
MDTPNDRRPAWPIAATFCTVVVCLTAGVVNADQAAGGGHGFAPVNGARLFYEVFRMNQ